MLANQGYSEGVGGTEGDLKGSMCALCDCQLLFQNTCEDQACLTGRRQQGCTIHIVDLGLGLTSVTEILRTLGRPKSGLAGTLIPRSAHII